MIYEPSTVGIVVFFGFVAITLALSFYLGSRAKSSQGYFAAHGEIPWMVNGIAFAGDYLSAASFLGICGMIAFYGYDGFLYSIGYLAGWIVALFVVAEPMKRLGKFTFADALDAKFNSRGIKLAAGISQYFLPDPANGRCWRPDSTVAGIPSLDRRVAGRHNRHRDCGNWRDGLNNLGAVSKGFSAGHF